MEGGTEAISQIQMPFGEGCGHSAGVFGLNIVVVGLDDGFLAREIVVGGAEGSSRSGGQFAHGDGFDAALAEGAEGGGEDVGASENGFRSGRGRIEHVQIAGRALQVVKNFSEHVQQMSERDYKSIIYNALRGS
jgi:hypothetical protein